VAVMAVVKIFCPACGSVLKLPDRRFLGKKARCGKCSRSFIAYEPDPDDIPPPGAKSAAEEEVVVVGARWVPDSPADQPATAIERPAAQRNAPPSPFDEIAATAAEGTDSSSPGFENRVRRRRRRKLMTLASSAVLVTVGWFVYDKALTAPRVKPKIAKAAKGQRTGKLFGEKDSDEETVAGPESPTQGKPISLKYVPSGARVLINLRPAVLWTNGGKMEEFRNCCGPLAAWLEKEMKSLCLDEPANIEEVLIALIPSEKGQPPEVSAVVHLAKSLKRSALLERFKGQLMDDHPRHKYYQTARRLYLIAPEDDRTYAVAPRVLRDEFLAAADNASLPPESLEGLLTRTDRDRHFTVAFEPVAVQIDAPFLMPAAAQPLLKGVLDWFGSDVIGVVWSAHLAPRFYSEVLVRNETAKSPERLHRQLYKQVDALPRDILGFVKQMNPGSVGPRKVIGRFPAMTSAYSLATRMDHDVRLVAMRTELPERAAPNLALGAFLTWDESTRNKSASTDPAPGTRPDSKQPATIAEKLAKKIDVDFRNEPLYAALDYIAGETGTKFKIEGNDLKMIGVTQNMKQQFKLENTPATVALDKMLTGVGLVIVVDESKQLITVTSAKAAQEKRLQAFPLKQPKP
jgi:hypothetical protein